MRQLVSLEFAVEMTPQGIGKLLARLGLPPQRPLYRAYQQDPEAVAGWKTEQYPAIRAQARVEGARVYFADEAGVRTDHHSGTTWAPVGQTPTVRVTGERGGVNMISAVSPEGTLHFEVFTGRCEAEVFIGFLDKLMHDAGGPVFRLKLFFLPLYSPELNPEEWVWKNIKHDQVGRRELRRKSEFFELVVDALHRLQRTPGIIRGFFQDPALAYIATP